MNRGENMDNQEEDVEGIDEDTENDRAGEKIPPWRIVAWNHDEPYQTRELAVRSTWRKRRKQETGMGLARQLGTRRKAKTANVHKRTVRIPATTTQRITGEGKAASSSSQNEERLRETVCDQDQEKVRLNRRLRKINGRSCSSSKSVWRYWIHQAKSKHRMKRIREEANSTKK